MPEARSEGPLSFAPTVEPVLERNASRSAGDAFTSAGVFDVGAPTVEPVLARKAARSAGDASTSSSCSSN